MASTPAVCEHVHLPVQSGSDAVLRRMLRRYTRARYLEVVAALRAAVPGITFSTDIIVGFPGETEAQFEETLTLVTDADFDDAYTFKYSVREGTPAVRLRDHVPDDVASARLERLIEAVRANARRKNVARVGEMHEVLVERPARRGDLMLGRTRTNQLVLLDLPAFRGRRVPYLSAHRHHRLHLHRRGRHARTGGPVIHNLAEEHVQASYESLRVARSRTSAAATSAGTDAMVYTLNRVPARYVSSQQGSVITEVSLEKDQSRAAIDVAMMDGLRRISLSPRCGAKRGGRQA